MSYLEDRFYQQLKIIGIPMPEREYRFHHKRRWRFDFAWIDDKLAVEIEGGAHINGRHNRGSGFIADMDKYNSAVLLGWRVLRFSGEHVKSGAALQTVESFLNTLNDNNKTPTLAL